MNGPHPATTNIASDSARVGMQVGTVHEQNNFYQYAPDDPPERKYEIGVRFLDGGMPKKARELLTDAIGGAYASSDVWFHWLLALLSYRTFRQISDEDLSTLKDVKQQIPKQDDNEWARGIRLIFRLLDSLRTPDSDFRLLLKELDALGPDQRGKILRHLDLILKGPLENEMWKRAMERVKVERTVNDRLDRVWMFFQAKPARPRVRQPKPPAPALAYTLAAWLGAPFFLSAAGYVGWLTGRAVDPSGLIACLIACLGGIVYVRYGPEWRFRVERMRAKEKELRTAPPRAGQGKPSGFVRKVDAMFDRYSAKYAPDGVDRSEWLAQIRGILRGVRDELVEIYRERPVRAEAIAWLIRHEIWYITARWRAGTLLAHRYELRTGPGTQLAVVCGVAALVVGGMWAVVSAVREEPLYAVLSGLVLATSGVATAKGWLRIVIEKKRFDADQVEYEQKLARRERAYTRWLAKLERKPSDAEMAAWLDCDRKLLMDRVMRHYQLTADAVIAYAFLEAPAKGYAKKARVRNGPWRYSHYRLLVFLLTRDGVRQASANLDFEKMRFNDWIRTNYRFDAVAAVYVTESDHHPKTFQLTLVNGESVDVDIPESGAEQLAVGEDSAMLSAVAIDASGLTNTLHILEGVAADGKDWIRHTVEREQRHITAFTAAVHGTPPE